MVDIREDKEKMRAIIQSLGNALQEILPDGWDKAVVGYFIAGKTDVSHQQIHVRNYMGDDYVDLMAASWDTDEMDDAIIEVGQRCKELRELCASCGDKWNSMTFVMLPDGSFHIDYGYEEIPEYDRYFILDWQSNYLVSEE